ncbi:hypothetical protein BJ165DRAFT_1467039 [Panaeolus papilionaceus]|nr:hypothetical protein BJ165DRAFT_1467039 [Panaeolus papilionaceus]
MIIDADVDTASVHTLVAPNVESHPTSNSHIPQWLSPLSFGFLAASIPPLIFSIISIHISLAYTLPTIITFVVSIPFHAGAWCIFCNDHKQTPYPFCRWRIRPKTIIVTYTILLQLLWLASAIMSSMVLLGASRTLKDFCSIAYNGFDSGVPDGELGFDSDCLRKTLMFFLTSTSLSVIVFVLLGAITITLLRWHPQSTPSLSTATPIQANDEIENSFSIIPLVHASFGLTLPPIMMAVDSLRTSFVAPYPISTAIAYALTTHIHVVTLVRWYRDIYTLRAPSKRLIPSFSYLLMVLIPWIASAVLVSLTFFGSWSNSMLYLGFVCYELRTLQDSDSDPIIERTCFTRAKLSLNGLAVATFIEVLIVGALILISARNQLRKRRMRNTNSSPSTGAGPSPKVIVAQPQLQPERQEAV